MHVTLVYQLINRWSSISEIVWTPCSVIFHVRLARKGLERVRFSFRSVHCPREPVGRVGEKNDLTGCCPLRGGIELDEPECRP
ncbi:hypothetical protein CEXT_566151 [Caerostris extrusa]|uniref:Uncharacterized protein n=1 Tax=Caerostris extrusa TaxID=172846 RepID=A0AAV4W5V2_CAEEX|nr:hypothetical protein CEXT_566151 [Caerostris extrusa]